MRWVLLGLLVIALAALLTFIVIYSRRRWWRSRVGRHIMAMNMVLAIMFTLALVGGWSGPVAGAVWMSVLIGLDLVLWGQVVLVLRAGRPERELAPAVRSADERKE